jgi:hypothetical protein
LWNATPYRVEIAGGQNFGERQVMHALNNSITIAHRQHNLDQHGTHQLFTEREFRKILAGYFSNKSDRTWCEDLGVDPPEGT